MLAEQIGGGWVAVISIALIVAGVVVWELSQRRRDAEAPGSTSAG
jgi:hypothetical protein